MSDRASSRPAKGSPTKKLLLYALPVVVLVAFRVAHDVTHPNLDNKPAPEFRLVSTAGDALALTELRGRPVVVNFWASWCGPCQAEHEMLQAASRVYGSQVSFVGIVFQDEPQAARAFLAAHESRYPQLLDPDGKVAEAYGVEGVPESFFVDSKGVVRAKHSGMLDGDVLAETLGVLLGGAAEAVE